MPDVHAQERHRRRIHELHGVQHRPVAAERDREVEAGREGRRPRSRTPRARPPARARPERAPRRPWATSHAAVRCASSCATGRSRCGISPIVLADAPVAVTAAPGFGGRRRRAPPDATLAAPRRACARNSTLPSAPRNGDGITARTPSPAAVESGDDLVAAPRGAPRGRARCPRRPSRARPASYWGFTSSTKSASAVGECEQTRRDRTQRDEREVGDAEIGTRIERRRFDGRGRSSAPSRSRARPGAATTRAASGRRRSRRRARRPAAAGNR